MPPLLYSRCRFDACASTLARSGARWAWVSEEAYLSDKAEGPSTPARAGGPPHAVHIVPRLLRQLIVYDEIHRGNVQAPACHIRGDQDRHLPRLEPAHRASLSPRSSDVDSKA